MMPKKKRKSTIHKMRNNSQQTKANATRNHRRGRRRRCNILIAADLEHIKKEQTLPPMACEE